MRPSPDPHTIDTLGKLADAGIGLAWACNHCHRTVSLTLDEAIRRWGRNQFFVQWATPLKCSECGSQDISMRVRAKVPGRT